MNGDRRERQITEAFVKVAGILTSDYDAVALLHDLLESSLAILGLSAGGIFLANAEGELQLLASTSDTTALAELLGISAAVGPGRDCFRSGSALSVTDIAADDSWPVFASAAREYGYTSVLATPLTLRGKTIGVMSLYGRSASAVSPRDAAIAQALSDVATIGLLYERTIRESNLVEAQLRGALESRILIEQAKGVIASSLSLSMDDAFALLRRYARDRNLTIRSVSKLVSERVLSMAELGAAVVR